jgi:hypothetical protein
MARARSAKARPCVREDDAPTLPMEEIEAEFQLEVPYLT